MTIYILTEFSYQVWKEIMNSSGDILIIIEEDNSSWWHMFWSRFFKASWLISYFTLIPALVKHRFKRFGIALAFAIISIFMRIFMQEYDRTVENGVIVFTYEEDKTC